MNRPVPAFLCDCVPAEGQENVLNRRCWSTRDELVYWVIHWIEHTYNRRRCQRGLGRLLPVQSELAFTSSEADVA